LKEVEKPTPKEDKVLVKAHAASVNAGDWHMLRGTPFLLRLWWGLLKPKNTSNNWLLEDHCPSNKEATRSSQ
jgi:NADPH:quinone reductase-like Zn-dependent oxidoreductase